MSVNDDSRQESFECPTDGCDRTFSSERGLNSHVGKVHPEHYPWNDEELLRELYVEEEMLAVEIASEWDVSKSVISEAVESADFPRRSRSESSRLYHDSPPVLLHTDLEGYELLKPSGGNSTVRHHRLLAVAKYGFDALRDNIVHHGSESHLPECEIPWANWEGNLEVMTQKDHNDHHKTINEDTLLCELRTLRDELGRSPSTRDMKKFGPHSDSLYMRRFGSWNEAKDLAFGE